MENYSLNEQQVYGKALGLYSNAFILIPGNFSFAWDLAQTYYVIKPLPTRRRAKELDQRAPDRAG